MKGQAFNPYLPENEYIPDGEPYVFGDRVYVYGSHDRFGAPIFCVNDYVCWSAPVDDLSAWKYEGVIYRKKQDPKNKLGLRLLFAPDVTCGTDGRYYLYYAFDVMGIMGVAVSESPIGPFQFHDHIHYPDGTVWGRKENDPFPFDPGVFVDDDGKIYLYSGFYVPVPAIVTGGKQLRFEGGYVLELEPDMVTIRNSPQLLFPKEGKGAYLNHEFFEASSMRKYGGTYYFVYSSRHNHELCYAVSDKPNGGFTFGGTLISNGDVFLNGNDEESQAVNYLGNNHGGLLELKGKYYIFYHRHTNRSSYARQACAEELTMNPDGSFQQVEMTSCGLNGGPLQGKGTYQARIACNLWWGTGAGRYDGKSPRTKLGSHPYFTQDKKDGKADAKQYIANMENGAVAGFKYFDLKEISHIQVEVRGEADGDMIVAEDKEFTQIITKIPICVQRKQVKAGASVSGIQPGVKPLYFQYMGNGYVDFISFTLG